MVFTKLPSGVRDILPRECRALAKIREHLARKFTAYGFEPVESATLEYFDTYSRIRNAVPEERMFKLSDKDGKLLVLRPDATLSISRIAATKLEVPKARLSYFTQKFDLQEAGGISSREILQAGVECLGEEGAFADAQTIAFAIECLKETGLKDFVVEVGHVGYFKGILEECGLSEKDVETVRAHVNAKDGLSAQRVLERAGVSHDALNAVLALPALFGGAEIFGRAEHLTSSRSARAAIARLREIHGLLARMGYEKYVCYDLGTVRRLGYYSGVIFAGLVREMGAPVMSGGRYDGLADDFGKHVPAVGFAMGLKRILIALERQGNLPEELPPDAVIACEEGAEDVGCRAAAEMTAAGKRAILLSEYGAAALTGCEAKEKFLATKEGLKKL